MRDTEAAPLVDGAATKAPQAADQERREFEELVHRFVAAREFEEIVHRFISDWL